ncbi:MAG: hypothetical protein JWQ78_1890 [Sediminibacterium sp.]|nr:hypothetical protein [Sediminibacterium sp.]
MRKLWVILLCVPVFLAAQSLSPERVAKVKSATVLISIEGITATGSGFFISQAGELLTCWHVIEPAFIRDSAGNMTALRRIFIQYADGANAEVSIPAIFYRQLYIQARSKDYCLLSPVQKLQKSFGFYRPGDFSKLNEGQELYSCGYAVGMTQPFVSRGILSTRYTDSSGFVSNNGVDEKVLREVALVDLTINKGFSGGPIIKMGATIEEDEVIGIANFLLSPFGQVANEVNSLLARTQADENTETILKLLKYLSAVNDNESHGIGACLSINHFLQDIQLLKK